MGYLFFVLMTAILMIRPAEINFAMFGYPFYEIFTIGSLIFSFQYITPQFETRELERSPITNGIIWIFVFNALSHAGNLQFDQIVDDSTEFVKLIVYYVLLIGLIDSPKRMISYLRWLTIFAGISTLVAFLYLYRYIQIDQENLVSEFDGQSIERMGGTGLFKDPNDLAVLVATFIPPSVFMALRPGTMILVRMFWFGMAGFFFKAILETQSRGGLLALGAGVAAYAFTKFGRKGIFLLAFLPVMLMASGGGRMSDMSLSKGTGQGRIQLQHEGFMYYLRRPVFGLGLNHYQDLNGHVAHNSYVQAMTETGFLGGALFTSCFYIAVMMLVRMGKGHEYYDPDMKQLRPYLLAMLGTQMVAKMSLSQTITIPTYMFLGFAAVFTRIAQTEPPFDTTRVFKSSFWGIVFQVGIAQTIFFFFYLNFMVRYS